MSPVVEKLTNRDYEVLYMAEALDEIMIESLRNYRYKDEEYDLVDATKEGLNLEDEDEESKKKKAELDEEYAGLKDYLETALEGKVQKVSLTTLLTNSPAALVQGAYGMSPTMQKYMKAQSVAAGGNDGGVPGSMNQAVLEINPNHPIVQDLDRMVKTNKDSEETQNFAVLLYDVAGMTSGYEIGDTKDFATRVMNLMSIKARDDNAAVQDAVVEDSADNADDEPAKEVEVL